MHFVAYFIIILRFSKHNYILKKDFGNVMSSCVLLKETRSIFEELKKRIIYDRSNIKNYVKILASPSHFCSI